MASGLVELVGGLLVGDLACNECYFAIERVDLQCEWPWDYREKYDSIFFVIGQCLCGMISFLFVLDVFASLVVCFRFYVCSWIYLFTLSGS